MKICRLRDSGTICFSVFLKRQPYIMQWRKYLVHCFLGEVGVVMPAGQPWCWIFYLTNSRKNHEKRLGFLRYVMFALSLALVSGLMLIKIANLEQIMFWLFIAGNVLYYILGIGLAFALKDNRAFCKYLCPVTVFLKPMSYFSFLRVHCDESKCIHCDKCLRVCPMNVEVNKESRKRKNGTECILCYECTKVCPTKALH